MNDIAYPSGPGRRLILRSSVGLGITVLGRFAWGQDAAAALAKAVHELSLIHI